MAYAIAASLQKAPQPDIGTLLDERIMKPLEVPACAWSISYGEVYHRDDMKIHLLEGGGSYTVRATARIGQLMLDRGMWDGQQLVDAGWVDRGVSHTDQPTIELRSGYPQAALGWWTNSVGAWPTLPDDAFLGAGADHQVLLVIPSLDLVVVRFGGRLGAAQEFNSRAFWNDLSQYVLDPLMETIDERRPAGS